MDKTLARRRLAHLITNFQRCRDQPQCTCIRIFFLPYLGNRSKSDPCSYELFCLESHILSFPKVLQIPPLSLCIKNQQDATLAVLFISHCSVTVHVSDAFASIIRSTKNCSSSHWCMSLVWVIHPVRMSEVCCHSCGNRPRTSLLDISPRPMACTSGCYYNF